jgi:hypothetical protein
MRTRRRAAFIIASAATFGVGLIAYTASAAAEPLVPACPFPVSPGNDSCVRLAVAPANAPNAFGGSQQLGFRWRTLYQAPAGAKEASVTLRFDDDLRFNLAAAGGNNCTQALLAGKTIAQAYAACGPLGNNTYLSTQVPGNPTLSGRASTAPPSNFGACTMLFKGPLPNKVLLYMRFTTVQNSNPNCTAPATNTGGNATFILPGTLTQAEPAPYKWKLTVPGINTALPGALALDDFYATIKRGAYFQARCPVNGPPTTPWILQGIFTYIAPQPGAAWTDTVNTSQPCS